ncbi:unnamed protein product [Caenorhabditis bovis]|uniref:Uncharacterized protein n=1 Tax=Caenorhabditis bovis TaxID=2654633 RepID=A0A8S1FA77_9PELO|nr:unnamed protein product [Caenorhabditis bovis]
MSTSAPMDSLHSKCKKTPEKRIQMRKKTPKELEEMATAKATDRALSCESTEDEPQPPRAVPSQTSMSKLNKDLVGIEFKPHFYYKSKFQQKVPMVKAFAHAEAVEANQKK